MILVLHQGHESVVHVQLHVAVEQAGARVVSHKLHLHLLPGGNRDHVLHDASRRLARDFYQFERMAMQVDRMVVVALIIEDQAVAMVARTWMGSVFGYSLPLMVQ